MNFVFDSHLFPAAAEPVSEARVKKYAVLTPRGSLRLVQS